MPLSATEADRLLAEFRERFQSAAKTVSARLGDYLDMGARRAVKLHEQGMTKERAVYCSVQAVVCMIFKRDIFER